MSLQRYVLFFGKLAPIYCLLEEICTGENCRWSQGVSFAARVQNLLNMFCGNVRLPGMFGLYAMEKSRNVKTQLKTFSFYSG